MVIIKFAPLLQGKQDNDIQFQRHREKVARLLGKKRNI